MNAIISAAGWKGSGASRGLAERPEPFLPLGDGTTSLSRSAKALSEKGYTVYIAMGKRGYPYGSYIRWQETTILPEFDEDFPWDRSPWTQELYDYASKLGTVLEMEDPGGWSTSLDTLCEAMDDIGRENWDRLFLTCGDMMIPRPCFEYIIDCEIPFVFSFTAYHACFGMDREGSEFFREYAEPYRRFSCKEAWYNAKSPSPNYQGVDVLKEHGFTHVQIDDRVPPCKWTDIDNTKTYQRAIKLVRDPEWA